MSQFHYPLFVGGAGPTKPAGSVLKTDCSGRRCQVRPRDAALCRRTTGDGHTDEIAGTAEGLTSTLWTLLVSLF